MNALIRLFWRLSLFRTGPEDMPYAPPLLVILLVAPTLWVEPQHT